MNFFAHPLFLSSCVLFLTHQILQKGLGLHLPFIDSYLDDILIMPILLFGLLYERRKLYGLGKNYQLKGWEIFLATLIVALTAELLFPYLSEKFTFDYFDFGAYFFGSLLFYLWSKKHPF